MTPSPKEKASGCKNHTLYLIRHSARKGFALMTPSPKEKASGCKNHTLYLIRHSARKGFALMTPSPKEKASDCKNHTLYLIRHSARKGFALMTPSPKEKTSDCKKRRATLASATKTHADLHKTNPRENISIILWFVHPMPFDKFLPSQTPISSRYSPASDNNKTNPFPSKYPNNPPCGCGNNRIPRAGC